MDPAKFVKSLRSLGVSVVERAGWTTHNRAGHGSWGPLNGVMIHHTGPYSGQQQMVDYCWTGDAARSLPGPLCHGVIDKSGILHMVGWGRANHAGLGDPDVLAAVVREATPLPPDDQATVDGNARFYGFELINNGSGKETFPQAQLHTAALVSYVLCANHKWTKRSVIGHKEWQPGKVDPAFAMEQFRGDVGQLLQHPPQVPAPKPPTPAPTPAPPLTDHQRIVALEGSMKTLQAAVSKLQGHT
jgi:hypothetical protein